MSADNKKSHMSPSEFVAAGETLFGSQWRRPMSELIKRSPRIVYYYAHGQRKIPEDVAEALREHTTLGSAGNLIRKAIADFAPEVKKHNAHRAAYEAEFSLIKAGLLTYKMGRPIRGVSP